MISGGSVIQFANRRGVPKSAVIPSGVAPLLLGFDAQTPEQISIRAPLIRAVAAGTTVDAEYRVTGIGSYIAAGRLFQVVASTLPSGAPAGIVNAFAGCIFGLTAGTTYDVRLTITEPSQSLVLVTGTQSTRALPATAPAANKSATPANLAAQLLTLVAGDCLQLADGTYSAFTLANSGSAGSPIYIRGTTRAGTVINAPSGIAITHAASHVVVENLTMTGSGVDSSTASSSVAISYSTGLGTPQTNTTIRNITATGFDRFCKAYEPVNGRLVYNCTITGNNTWALTYSGVPPNDTWNDDGVSGPGQGNCFFDSTINGHGDVLKLETSSGIYYTAAAFMYRIKCGRTGDDFAETDDGSGNIAIYDCEVKNAGTALSVDGVYGGPVYYFRNRVGNTARGPFKPTSESRNIAIYSNTFIRTTSATTFGFYAASSGTNSDWKVKNNVLVYRGASDVLRFDCDLTRLDWDYNAIYPSTGANITLGSGRGTQASLAAAKTALAPLMAHDVAATTNPFAATITFGTDYQTEYTGTLDLTLAGGASELGAGVVLSGITDGFTGAAPDIGAVISGRAVALAGDPSAIPSWYSAINVGEWGVLSTSTLAASGVGWAGASPGGSSNYSAIVTAWGGAAIGTDGIYTGATHIAGDFLILHGGGHGDYGGNEVYGFGPLFSDAPLWYRLRDPTVPEVLMPTETDGSGNPVSVHSSNVIYVSDGTRKWLLRAGAWGGHSTGSGVLSTHAFDMAVASPNSNQAWLTKASSGNGTDNCAYETSSGKVWAKRQGTSSWVGYYDVAANTWTEAGSKTCPFTSTEASSAVDQARGIFFLKYGTTGGLTAYRTNNGAANDYYTPTTTGSAPTGLTAMVYDPVADRFVAWNGNGKQLFTFTPPASSPYAGGNAWTWASITPAGGSTPTAQATNGTYGRFAYLARNGLRGYVLLNSTSGSVYFYRAA